MKAALQSIYTNPKYTKVFEWGKLITITGGAQIIIQATGLISGIIIIRMIPTHEYALYTLANTMLGTMSLLSDGGISIGVMAEGGKVWQDRIKLGSLITTGLDLRKSFSVGVLIVSIPILLYLLLQHGASWMMSIMIIVAIVPAFLYNLSGTLLQIPPKLKQDIIPLQRIHIEMNTLRMIITVSTIIFFPFAFIAISSGSLSQIWANIRLKKISHPYVSWNQKSDPIVKTKILIFVKRIFPTAVYICLSSQITIWLISAFGSTSNIAQIGALSRITMTLGVFSILFSTLISPRFARLPDNPNLLLKRYSQIQFILIVFSLFIVGIAYLYPEELLWILGSQYANLNKELLLLVIGNCCTLIYNLTYTLYSSKGWLIKPSISISISLAATLIGIFILNISTIEGVLLFNIFIASIEMIMHIYFGYYKIIKLNNVDNNHKQ